MLGRASTRQYCGGTIDLICSSCERIGREPDLLRGFVPIVLFDGFADSRQRFGAVARIKTGRVDCVLEPRTTGKAAIVDQREFDLPKRIIEGLLCIAGPQPRSR